MQNFRTKFKCVSLVLYEDQKSGFQRSSETPLYSYSSKAYPHQAQIGIQNFQSSSMFHHWSFMKIKRCCFPHFMLSSYLNYTEVKIIEDEDNSTEELKISLHFYFVGAKWCFQVHASFLLDKMCTITQS